MLHLHQIELTLLKMCTLLSFTTTSEDKRWDEARNQTSVVRLKIIKPRLTARPNQLTKSSRKSVTIFITDVADPPLPAPPPPSPAD